MNLDLLKGVGIGGGTVLGVVLFVIFHFDKACLFVSWLLRCLWFVRILRRKSYTMGVQGKVNDICKNMAPELFDKSLRIKWLKKKEIYKSFSTDTSKEIIVHVVDARNPNKNLVSILQEYTSTSFIPNLRMAVRPSFVNANEQYIISKIVKAKKDDSLSAYYSGYAARIIGDEEKELSSSIYALDRGAYYFPCFINSLDSVDENIGSYALDDRTDAEVSNFTKFLYDIATKGPWEEADLMFTGHLFRISVILVAKKETLDVAGLRAHFDRVRLVATEGVDRIYIRGIGRENILNVKRLINLLKGIPHLNKIREKRYMVEDISGKRRTLLMAVYENYYEKGLEQEEQEAEEIVELLSAHIPEVDNGSIEVVKVAREKGIMTKVLLRTNFEHIHVVACCIGSNFERKNKIESKLVEENIYFVEDSDDVKTLIGRALCPFRMEDIESTRIRTRDKSAIVVVDDGKIGAAIGKLGINVKLASQLVGWKIKIIESSDSQ